MAHIQIDLRNNPAHAALTEAAVALGVDFAALVARVAIWAPLAAHAERVSPANPSGAVYPLIRWARPGSGERTGSTVDGLLFDRNNYAGHAIRRASGLHRDALVGFQACHIWPATCYDARDHTVLANLVLIPASLVSLTDHEPSVMAALPYRVFALYGWHPEEVSAPRRPTGYPEVWRAPALLPLRSARRALHPAPPSHEGLPMGAAARPAPASQREVLRRLW